MVVCRGNRVEKEQKIASIRDEGTSKFLPEDLDKIRFRQEVTKVGSVGVVTSRTRVWYGWVMQ
jgi:hypothetical protein